MSFKKLLPILMTLVMVFLSMPLNVKATSFKDVNGHWAEENINWAAVKGLVKGYPDGKFKPEGKITRAEFVTMINNYMKAEKEMDFSFKDIKGTDWYNKEVRKAVNYYLQDGDYFNGNEYISRDEAAKLMAAAYGLKDMDLKDFKDSDEIINKGSVAVLVEKKVLSGYPDGSFKPKNLITRAETARIFNVAYNNIGQASTETAINPNKKQKSQFKSSNKTLVVSASYKTNTNSTAFETTHKNHDHDHGYYDNEDVIIPVKPDNPNKPDNPIKSFKYSV